MRKQKKDATIWIVNANSGKISVLCNLWTTGREWGAMESRYISSLYLDYQWGSRHRRMDGLDESGTEFSNQSNGKRANNYDPSQFPCSQESWAISQQLTITRIGRRGGRLLCQWQWLCSSSLLCLANQDACNQPIPSWCAVEYKLPSHRKTDGKFLEHIILSWCKKPDFGAIRCDLK